MNDSATIFDDRETVEFLRDHPHLLAIADAVTATQGQPSTVRRHRWPLLVAAAAAIALVAGLSLVLIPQSSHKPGGGGDVPEGLRLIPDGPIGSAIGVKMEAPAPAGNATLKLQVLRAAYPPGADPNSFNPDWHVVYESQVPMTEATKGDPAKGDNPLWTWSGTLSTRNWSGGCQKNGFIYSINATVLDSTGVPAAIDKGDWLTCAG